MTLLAICHTIVPEREKDNPESIVYQGASPGNLETLFISMGPAKWENERLSLFPALPFHCQISWGYLMIFFNSGGT